MTKQIKEILKFDKETQLIIDCAFKEGKKQALEDELKFLESFDWTIAIDSCKDAKEKMAKAYEGFGYVEHFDFIIKEQNQKIKRINDRIKEIKQKLGEMK